MLSIWSLTTSAPAALSRMAEGKKVVLGLVTTKFSRPEDKDTVIARIHEAEKWTVSA